MSKEIKEYEVVHPIAWGGRVERGETVKMSEADARGYGDRLRLVGTKPVEDAPEEKALEDMNAKELKAEAKKRNLAVGGSKADLLERIKLSEEAPEGGDEDGEDSEGDSDGNTEEDSEDGDTPKE